MLAALRQSSYLLNRHKSAVKAFNLVHRCLSSQHTKFDTTISSLAADLRHRQPQFSVTAHGVRILSQPSDFYTLLLDMIRTAERRIFISSLYIGSSENELISTLMSSLEQKDALHLYIQLDLNRSTRPGSSSTAKILLPLLRAFPERVHVSLFRSPNLRGIMAKLVPPRFNEGWGTWHAKIYGADDDVMISGANLSKTYFTNRRDRYILFKDQPRLSNYCFDFLRIVSTFSYQLLPNDSFTTTNPHSYSHDDYSIVWPDPDTHPHKINEKAQRALSSLQASHRKSQDGLAPSSVMLFPVIQAGQFNIHEEEQFFELLFGHLKKGNTQVPLPASKESSSETSQVAPNERPLIDLTSGYFGLYQPYQQLLLANPQVDVRIVAASPKANGFFGSKGISGRIPEGYTYLEQRFMKAVKRAERLWRNLGYDEGPNVQLSEWQKDGWTYHAKGLWLSPTPTSPPVLTLFGSTNLNSRSSHIDTELSFVMILPPSNPVSEGASAGSESSQEASSHAVDQLRTQLAGEVQRIREDVHEWKGGERNVRFGTKLLVRLLGGML